MLWPALSPSHAGGHSEKPTGDVSRTIVGAAVLGIVLLLSADLLARAGYLFATALVSVVGVAAVLLGLIHTIRDIRYRLRTRRDEKRSRRRRPSR